ncbi:hypothetical protein PPYR_00078 [Photinus pyralis]|uniref:HAT C-terminal dimerisation domain-containing protein n=1 Tax=Photinus pyralis TaxID=7054 RepID=A0A5N4B0R6_PHOPY|nr:hypothetical protein PPYR_00078 [Photinus pyralis]
MNALRTKITSRMNEHFFGSKVKFALNKLGPQEKRKFEKEATEVYQRTLDYLSKFYDFENSPFNHFSSIDIRTNGSISFNQIMETVTACRIDVNQDALFDEIDILKSTLDKLKLEINFADFSVELYKIVSRILSVPVSNAYVERVFSLMSNLWTDERNRMRVDLVKAELCTKLNFNMSCQEFTEYIKRDEQKELLTCCKSNKKYSFKFKK